MNRRRRVVFSGEQSGLDEIKSYYETSLAALDEYVLHSSSYFAWTDAEITAELQKLTDILERMCSLELLTAIEARFRVDYLIRCQHKLKDSLSKAFRKVYETKHNRASLEEDILTAWRKHFPMHKSTLDELRQALVVRHWFAHGRYWKPNRNYISKFDYLSVLALATHIFAEIDLKRMPDYQ